MPQIKEDTPQLESESSMRADLLNSHHSSLAPKNKNPNLDIKRKQMVWDAVESDDLN